MSDGIETTAPVASAPEPSNTDEFDAVAAEAFADIDAPGTPAAIDDETGKTADAVEPPAPGLEPAAQTPAADGEASPAGTTPSDDPWAKAPPELREARQKDLRDADLRLKSVQGRQSAADREVQRLRDQLAEIKRGGTAQPQAERGAEPAATSDPTHAKLREDYPEIAGPLLDQNESFRKELEDLKAGIGEVQQDRTTAYLNRQETLLSEKHPDWLTALGDDRFAGWLEEQPRAVKEAYARNVDAIVDGPEAAWLVDQWKRSGVYEVKTPTPTPAPADDRRAKQLQNGRDLGRTAPPATSSEAPEDLDGAAMAVFREEQRRARA